MLGSANHSQKNSQSLEWTRFAGGPDRPLGGGGGRAGRTAVVARMAPASSALTRTSEHDVCCKTKKRNASGDSRE